MPDSASLTAQGLPQKHVVSNVPVIEQKDHYCGPAALATMAQYNGRDLTQDEASELVYTPGRKGTFQHDVVSGMQRQGLLAVPVNTTEDLLTELSNDNPVIIFQNLGLSWIPTWHYSVITGYDLPNEKLLVHGGAPEAKWKDTSTVGKTWKRAGFWGYVAVLPDEIPATASEAELLQAVAGLEAAGKLREAELGYKSIIRTNAHSDQAYLGLGNIAMTEKLYKRAEQNYRKALSLNAENIYAANNLAYALKSQDRKTESCKVLEQNMIHDSTIIADSFAELCQ